MKKRALSLLMAVLMVVGLLPATARAAESGDTVTGDVSVSSAAELAALGGKDVEGNITLTNDIEMTDVAMEPIKSLTGCFNGDGKTISNLTLVGQTGGGAWAQKYTALIGTLNGGSIKNLKLEKISVSADTNTANYNHLSTLIGYVNGGNCTIENCVVTGNVTYTAPDTEKYPSTNYVSGLVGEVFGYYNNSAELQIVNCTVDVAVTGAKKDYAAGLVATSGAVSGTVENCAVLGNVTADKSVGYAGGLLGATGSSTQFTFSNCYYAGTVSGSKARTMALMTSTKKNAGTLTYNDSCYYLKNASQEIDAKGGSSTTVAGDPVAVESTAELKALKLNGFEVREGEFNNYPVPKWTPAAAPDPVTPEPSFSCALTFTGTEGGTLTVTNPEGKTVAANEDGAYTYTLTFADGSIYSNITNGSFTVEKGDTEKTIAVKLTYKTTQPSGEGTAESPYSIGTAEELRWFAERVNALDTAAAKAYVKLTKNIEVPGSWTPLGKNASYAFSGHFDGDGHSVTITVDDPGLNYFGFFGCLDSKPNRNSATPIDEQPTVVVENLTVNGTIYCSEPGAFVGGIAARAMGKVELKNCVNKATVSSLARASSGVGGLVGGYDDGVEYVYKNIRMTVDGCTNNGTITVTGDNEKAYVGGLVGSNKNCVQVKDSANTGTVNAPGCTVGGLLGQAGYQTGDYKPSIADSSNTGTLIGAEGKTNNLYGKGTIGKDNITNSGDNTYTGGSAAQDELLAESLKYSDVLALPSSASVGDSVTLLKDGEAAAEDIKVTCSQGEKDTNQDYLKVVDGKLQLAKKNTTGKVIEATATITWVKDGKTLSKPVTVNIYPAATGEDSARKTLMKTIAGTYKNSSSDWVVFDMAAYEKCGFGSNTTDKQNYLNLAVNELAGNTPLASDRAKAEIIFAALGVDSTQLTTVDGLLYNNAEKLASMNLGSSHYTAPWVLLAEQAGQVKLTDAQRNRMIALLTDSGNLDENGVFFSTWAGETYADPDTTGTALAALAQYNTSEYPEVQKFINKAVAGLSKAQGSNGSFGNVNSDAMVIIGLAAVGIDPAGDSRFVKGGCSLADALLLYVNDGGNGFTSGYASGTQGEKAQALATEQGFRALVTLEKLASLSGDSRSFNIYTQTAKVSQDGSTTVTTPDKPTQGFDSDKAGTPEDSTSGGGSSGSAGSRNVTVRVTIRSDETEWAAGSYTVAEGKSAFDALKKAMDAKGIDYQGDGSYIKSLTRDGVTLGQMDKGPNSGWMYKINGEMALVSLEDYVLKTGDQILFYYVLDYTKEDTGTDFGGGGGGGTAQPEQPAALPFTDVVDTSWFYAAVKYAYEHKLFGGTSATEFSPEATMTRGMAATILYSLEGSPAVSGKSPFSDVADGQWYAKAVTWAEENGIVGGIDSENCAPEAGVTREQLAAILYRYAQYKKYSVSVGEDTNILSYDDAEQISSYAVPAIQWACGSGLMTGRTQTALAPVGTVTRAEVAVMLQRFCENNIK